MKCLVTGGAGFIGSHIVDALINLDREVIVIDNESAKENEKFYWNKKAENYKYDICDIDKINPLFKNVDCVFHLAADSRIQRAIENPQKTINVNLLGTLNVLDSVKKNNVKRIIYSSTSAYYGIKNVLPHEESMKSDCLNPYSIAKVAGEDLIKMYSEIYGLESIIFRYFNVYGERQPLMGDYAPVIGLFIKQMKKGEKMTVVGTGNARRDFTHVSDVVEANILAAEKSLLDSYKILNIGSGKNYSIMDIAKMIGGPFKFIPSRKGEAKETLACIKTANQYLGWKPKINLEEWIEKNK